MMVGLRLLRLSFGLALLVALGACFKSVQLFKEQRLWETVWYGRYLDSESEYIVLPADAASRTYLLGQFKRENGDLKAYRVALYPGWDAHLILGTRELPYPGAESIYVLIRRAGEGQFEMINMTCDTGADDKAGGNQSKCDFATIDSVRAAMKARLPTAKTGAPAGEAAPVIERLRDKPLAAIGVATEVATFENGDGVHGALRVRSVSARLPATAAGVRVGDLIVAVDGFDAASAHELVLRIARAKPGTAVKLRLYDPRSRATREVPFATAAWR
jgi:hypothetical protein